MRVERLIALLLLVPFCSRTQAQDAQMPDDIARRTVEIFDPWAEDPAWAGQVPNIFEFNIVQRTCALEVVLRARGLEGRDPFKVPEKSTERIDASRGASMFACTGPPSPGTEAPKPTQH